MRPSPFLPSAHWFHLSLPPFVCSARRFHICLHRRHPLSACRFHLYIPPQPPRFHLRLPPASRLRRPLSLLAFSLPLIPNHGAPPPHRFHIGPASAVRKGADDRRGKNREGLFPLHWLHVDFGGPAFSEAELVALRGAAPGAPGHVRRGVPATIVHAAVHACDVTPPERVLHIRSAAR